jgi:hypothetical protein
MLKATLRDYLGTYGWAVLVLVIVGSALWKAGLFGNTAPGASGFGALAPGAWAFSEAGSQIVFLNHGDEELFGISVSLLQGSDCLENAGGVVNAPVSLALNATSVRPGGAILASPFCIQRCASRPYAVAIKVVARVTYATASGAARTEDGAIQGRCG